MNLFLFYSSLMALLLFDTGMPLKSQHYHAEKDGIVALEAEHYAGFKGAWEEVEGRNAYTEKMQGFGASLITSILGNEGKIYLANSPVLINWGRPGREAISLASLETDKDLSVAFMYHKGDQIPGGSAPGNRMGIFSGRKELNQEGWKFLDHALQELLKESTTREKVLFIHGGDSLQVMDTLMIPKLMSLGMQIKTLKDDEPAPSDIDHYTMVYISESVSSGSVADRYAEVSIPVVVCEPYVFDDMGMVHSELPWAPSNGQKGNAMLSRYGKRSDYLRYTIHFKNPGSYHIQLLGQNDGSDEPVKIQIAIARDGSDPVEGGSDVYLKQEPGWQRADQTLRVQYPGWYQLFLYFGIDKKADEALKYTSTYPSWRIDKLLLSLDETPVSGDGPEELLVNTEEKPENNFEKENYFPEQIWNVKEGFVYLEAEDIDHHPFWNLKNEPIGYTGEGYLVWNGPPRERSIEGLGGNDDAIFVRQGPAIEWLIISVNIEEPGNYSVNARNIHFKKDGDNDAWVSTLGFRPDDPDACDSMVRRMGDSHTDGEGFTWLDWGVRTFPLEKGVNHIYIGGRSPGFGIDRIAIYKEGDPVAERKALFIGQTEASGPND